jgi:DNA helicase II / ATP-dependent DNA helicase PcrA
MTFLPSPQQATFLDWIANARGSAVMVAVAGAGKTKSIELALPLIPESQFVTLVAFNTTIAKELNARIEKLRQSGIGRAFSRVQAKTFHGLGFGAVRKRLGNINPNIDSGKCRKLVKEWLGEEQQEMYSDFICKLVSLAKGIGIGTRLQADTTEAWQDIIHHHDLYLEHEEATEEHAIQLARELLRRSCAAAEKGSLDFDDQLYMVLKWNLKLWQNDWVFVDEAQDTNPVRRALAKLALRPNGRLVAVGDPRQAIYGFTGASHDAIDLIKAEFNAIELPLTVSFRCAQSVVREAQAIVPYIQPAEAAPEGRVESLPLDKALAVLDAHDAVLCRNTAPLIAMAFKLIADGRGCIVLGKDIGAGLVSLIKKQNAKGVDALLEKLEKFRAREYARYMEQDEPEKADGINDRVACVRIVCEQLPEGKGRTVPAAIAKLEGLFSDTNGVLTLSTAHKAKGREWRRVAILRPELMPGRARQEWQQVQEKNLMYVAYTRAMEHLIFMQA